jgi:hypothetical protein
LIARLLPVLFVAALCVARAGVASGPSSANYAIPSSVINNGVAPMSSQNFSLRSSLGDPFFGGSQSAGFRVAPGFWPTIKGVGKACILDLDGNGEVDALTDGVMLIRILSGLTGDAVTNNAIGNDASRTTWAQIQPLIVLSLLDVDDNGSTEAQTDGLMILRASFGLTGNAVTNSALGSGTPNRNNWAAIRSYLNTTCGTAFAP